MTYVRGVVTVAALVLSLILLYKLWYGRRSLEDTKIDNDNEYAIQLTDSTPVVDASFGMSDSIDPSSSFPSLRLIDSTSVVDTPFVTSNFEDTPNSFPSVEYEVFLSFRGPDTRNQITDILYRFLCRTKIHTFKDDNELRKGEEIGSNLLQAIDQSKIYVPIISKNYAHSKWCLIELAEIIRRQEQDTRRIILPIFYMVDPRDVRHQTGPYENAFQEHCKKFDETTIKNWKDALNKIGALKGWHVKSNDESMIKLGDEDVFQMHDQLRDMGREIIREENIEHPWMRSRIWSAEEGKKIIYERKGSNLIKALRAKELSIGVDAIESLTNLSELRYFEADSSRTLVKDINNFLPNLRWLQLHRYNRYNHEECEPPLTNFNMKNLVILDLWKSFIPDNWGGWSQIQMAERLKLIDLSHCSKFRRLPRFPRSVEILKLINIKGQKIPELDIGELKKLKVLYLKYSKLQKITGGTFGMLKGLQELDLTNFKCKNLREVMIDVGELSSLKILRTKGAREVEYETPIGLKELSTSSRISNLAEMLELEVLEIYDCKFGFDIPPMWWKRSKLKTLWIGNTNINGGGSSSNNNMITTMLPSSLTSLIMHECHAWLPSLVNLGNLTHLEMVDCQTLCNHLDGIEGLTSLKNLLIYGAKGLARITGLTNLLSSPNCKLEQLAIFNCPDLIELHDDDKAAEVGVVVNSLQLMNIVDCPQLDAGPLVRGLTKFPMLRVLCLVNIKFTEHQLEGVGSLQELEYCFLKLPSLERITPLSKLQKLNELLIAGAHGLREIEGLGELMCLETLILANCTSLERLWHADDRLENLNTLDIRNCRSLSVEHLSALKAGLPPNVKILWPDEPCEDDETDSSFCWWILVNS